ncbi:hypothetical protein BGX28_002410 [Mortierella sp. GBA30]|nr:hypothetical protein BGX28_002410 [Mortierella sp. GBA30]
MEGRIDVTITSKILANQFYGVLRKARGVQELSIKLEWDVTMEDLRTLANAVTEANKMASIVFGTDKALFTKLLGNCPMLTTLVVFSRTAADLYQPICDRLQNLRHLKTLTIGTSSSVCEEVFRVHDEIFPVLLNDTADSEDIHYDVDGEPRYEEFQTSNISATPKAP